MTAVLRMSAVCLLATLLAACGGGSSGGPGGNDGPVTQEKLEQAALVFEHAEVEYYLYGEIGENTPTGGSGEGALTFGSTDENVATVDTASGEVTVIAAGVTTIEVTKAADDTYKEAAAEYQLTVVGPPSELEVDIGTLDSQLSISGYFTPTDFYRYTNSDCDIESYAVCTFGNLTVVEAEGQLPVEDDYIAIDTPAYIQLSKEGLRSEPVRVSAERPPFVRRRGAAMISFNGKLFVIGGQDNSAGESGNDTYSYNDIWSSVDGVSWELEAENAGFSARAFHQIVEFQGSLYLIGGEESLGTGGASWWHRDVWKSDDGIAWTKVVEEGPFNTEGQSIVFDNKIWVIGDSAFSGESKVYSSTDGVAWDLELTESPFGSREQMAVFAWQGKLFVTGGMGSTGSDDLLNDVWSSPDGRVWTQETTDAGYEARVGMSVAPVGDKLVMVGGHSFSDGHNSVYESSDGVTWTLLVAEPFKRMNQTHSLAVHTEKLWVYSGLVDDYVWFSEDGESWKAPARFPLQWQVIPQD
ncbi:hypothetical protein [uncultured Microbulbifer sp.]|uniref:hypothetical protein n=1 Tax=uncultured Microbulbifer sp. TaxID=348147 RepID=UPI00345DAF33